MMGACDKCFAQMLLSFIDRFLRFGNLVIRGFDCDRLILIDLALLFGRCVVSVCVCVCSECRGINVVFKYCFFFCGAFFRTVLCFGLVHVMSVWILGSCCVRWILPYILRYNCANSWRYFACRGRYLLLVHLMMTCRTAEGTWVFLIETLLRVV